MKILHITPHLGGGVGVFLNNIASADLINEHEFCLLEHPIDMHLLENVSWKLFDDVKNIFNQYVSKFDIVQIEFWNHPVLFKFLIENKLPDCRLVVYVHTSGIYPPNIIPNVLFDFADSVVLSTPAAIDRYSKYIEKKKCHVIHGIGGAKKTVGLKRIKHDGINIVYIGTASYSKLHPGFVQACFDILKKISNIKFIFASNDDNSHLKCEAEKIGIDNHFEFIYRSDNIELILSKADLFGYPLRSDHFGTGEQVLLEAMGAGVPPVVIGNLSEKSLIKDGLNGFIAKDIYEYVAIIQYCITHPELLEMVGRKTREFCMENFTIEKTLFLFQEEYMNIINCSKSKKTFREFISFDEKNEGFYFFNMCIGECEDMLNYENSDNDIIKMYYLDKMKNSSCLMKSNKGGMAMYRRYYPNDKKINNIFNYLNEGLK